MLCLEVVVVVVGRIVYECAGRACTTPTRRRASRGHSLANTYAPMHGQLDQLVHAYLEIKKNSIVERTTGFIGFFSFLE